MKKKNKILIVEDEVPLLKILYETFKKEGYEVCTAKDGAVGLATALTERPDIILLDIKLPVMDGLKMLTKLRSMEKGKETPVILLTNYDDPENVAKALEEHSFDYLIKTNWKMEDVVKKVNQRLHSK